MAVDNIFQRYGIKEVADISFYSINSDGTPGKLELYIDTAKTSTIEQTAESVDARGGKGNPALISWDYGKEITVTLEDALFSAKSMQMMFGEVDTTSTDNILRSYYNLDSTVTSEDAIKNNIAKSLSEMGVLATDITIKEQYNMKGQNIKGEPDETGTPVVPEDTKPYLIKYELGTRVNKHIIKISNDKFPGTYYVVGDTYARNETTGKDEFFQFVIPKAKMNVENTLTLQAEGDPTVFNMSLKVLRPASGTMMQLIKYDLPTAENNEDDQAL